MKLHLLGLLCGICYMFCLFSAWGILKDGKIEILKTAEDGQKWADRAEAEYLPETEEVSGIKDTEKAGEAPRIALTFDDGPAPESTEFLLDGLQERGVKVTFFVIGVNVEKYPEIVKREAEEGHIVGNHTYNHVEITRLSEEEAAKEITDTSSLIQEITGHPAEFMRPPFGAWQRDLELDLEVIPVLWTVDPLDWTTENEDEIVNKVVTDVKENDIILLHDCYLSSVKAALRIIDILQKEGYEFVTVDELLLD